MAAGKWLGETPAQLEAVNGSGYRPTDLKHIIL